MAADEHGQTGRKRLAEGIAAAQRDPQPDVGEGCVGGDQGCRPDETELLADDREDHVRMRLGEEVRLLDALTETAAEDAAGAESDHGLDDLKAGPLRIVPRVDEAEDSRPPIGLEPDRGHAERGRDRQAGSEDADRRPGHEQHPGEHHEDRDRRSKVGLEHQQRSEDTRERSNRAPELLERRRRAPASQVGGGPDGERELRQLGRLEDCRAEGEPAARAVDRGAEHEDRREQPEARDH